jgi:LEA14-like dessication related protein
MGGLTGCKYLEEFLKDAFQQPSFVFKNVALTNLSLAGLNLDTVWQLDNPNAVGLSLAQVDYALFIEGKQVVAGQPQQGLQIAARGSSDLHFPADIKFQDLVAVVETFLNKDTAHYRATGTIGVQTPIGLISLPLAKDGDFEVPKIPHVVFGNPKVSNLTLTGATIDFPLTVTNRNSFALPINGVTGALTVAGAHVGQLGTPDFGAVEGKGTRQVNLPVQVNFLSAAGALVTAVQTGQAPVKFDAQLHSGGLQLPVKVDQLLNFTR